eukprot:TRINITY_DN5077_c0_g1_i1.p1 TRINITY_DN5077_c0_g1~~TRINITY_DN5077_c0_g1_i1.p1  ORF type:complete len:162 (-),score=32.31 TRINITY_DN5077_c0_g1_i1:254-739(-)
MGRKPKSDFTKAKRELVRTGQFESNKQVQKAVAAKNNSSNSNNNNNNSHRNRKPAQLPGEAWAGSAGLVRRTATANNTQQPQKNWGTQKWTVWSQRTKTHLVATSFLATEADALPPDSRAYLSLTLKQGKECPWWKAEVIRVHSLGGREQGKAQVSVSVQS